MVVLWSKKAHNEVDAIYNYILKKQKSPQNAVLVFNAIFDLANSLVDFPFKYPVEPALKNERVRFAVIYSFKIIYVVKEDTIVVLRVFNTTQSPIKISKQ